MATSEERNGLSFWVERGNPETDPAIRIDVSISYRDPERFSSADYRNLRRDPHFQDAIDRSIRDLNADLLRKYDLVLGNVRVDIFIGSIGIIIDAFILGASVTKFVAEAVNLFEISRLTRHNLTEELSSIGDFDVSTNTVLLSNPQKTTNPLPGRH